ncbi:MAG: anti-sigma factor family protein [Planctomycetota bacterium]
MRRSRLEALLQDYVAGDLGDAQRRDVERRVDSDPKARAILEEVRAAQDALSLLRDRPEPPVSARDVFPQIQAAIAAHAFEPRPRLALEGLGTRYYRRLAIAATLLFALTVGFFSLRGSTETAVDRSAVVAPPPPADLSVAGVTSAVEAGSRRDGISAEEFFRLLAQTRDPNDLRVEPVINFRQIARSR